MSSTSTLQNPRPFVTVELTRTGKIPRKATVPANARLRIVSDNNLSLDVMRKAVDVAKPQVQARVHLVP